MVSFRADLTKTERETTADACCYGWFEPCPGGRPLRNETMILVADAVRRDDWGQTQHRLTVNGLDVATRTRLAAHWVGEAAAEHASIASFHRFALQLLALAAPRDLVAAAHEAAGDEIRHAEHCYALASRYAGEPIGPGPLVLPHGEIPTDPVVVAMETLRDGCLGETLAAHYAAEAGAVAQDPDVATLLAGIAVDEESHAELAWRTVAWLLAHHGEPIRDALEMFLADVTRDGAVLLPSAASRDEAHGVLGLSRRLAIQREAVREIVIPCIHALLHGTTSGAVPRSAMTLQAGEGRASRGQGDPKDLGPARSIQSPST